ncbi:MAG: glycosyltransferase [Bacteroidetes bacterium]|jgi:rhamnosyltransferase|nr:glycosyltransferase [Bacteroidota bacterium]
MRILGIVSVFRPSLADLEKNILSYLSGVDHLILWENTPSAESNLNLLANKINNSKIEIKTTGKNEYLAYPFNVCINWAIENGFTHILTMDQDSYFSEGHFDVFKQTIENNNDDKIAIFTPTFETNVTVSQNIHNLKLAYTSGAVYPTGLFTESGYFREDLLIYAIDTEFSFRVRKLGYRIVRFENVVLHHQMGYATKNKLGLTINNYPAISSYYIIRNTIILWKEYPEEFTKKDKVSLIKYKVIYRLLKLVFETDRLKKIKAILLGTMHGFQGKSGYYNI